MADVKTGTEERTAPEASASAAPAVPATAPPAPATAPAAATPVTPDVQSQDSLYPQQDLTAAPIQGDLQEPQAVTPPPSGITPAGRDFKTPEPGSFFKNLSHAFAGALLSGLGGNERIGYRIDEDPTSPNYGKMLIVRTPLSTGEKIKNIVRNTMSGLIVAAQMPPEPSGRDGLAAFGAGAAGVLGQQAAQQAMAQQQAAEEFERLQKAEANKAIRWKNTIDAFNSAATFIKNDQSLDPLYELGKSIYSAASDPTYGIPGVRVMSSDQWEALAQTDHNWGDKYYPVLIGKKVAGVNADGSPRISADIALIPQDSEGQVKIPAALAEGISKYGRKYILGWENLKEGAAIPANRLPALVTAVLRGQADSITATPELVEVDGKLMQQNPITKEQTPATASQQAEYEAKKATIESTKALGELRKAQTEEAKTTVKAAEGVTELGNTAAAGAAANLVAQLPPDKQQVLKPFNPETQAALIALAFGDSSPNDWTNRLYRGSPVQITRAQATGLAKLINPKYTAQLYSTKQALQRDYTVGRTGQNIRAFNQFLEHAKDARDIFTALTRTNSPWLNAPIQNIRQGVAGDPELSAKIPAVFAVISEWQNFLKNNLALKDKEVAEGSKALSPAATPRMFAAALSTIIPQAVARLDQINETWKTATGEDYPNLLTPSGRAAAVTLGFGPQIAKYGTGGTLGGVPLTGGSAGMTRVILNGVEGMIPTQNVPLFKQKYPNATVIQ